MEKLISTLWRNRFPHLLYNEEIDFIIIQDNVLIYNNLEGGQSKESKYKIEQPAQGRPSFTPFSTKKRGFHDDNVPLRGFHKRDLKRVGNSLKNKTSERNR